MNLLELFYIYLSSQKTSASKSTIKNYVADVNQFISWYEKTYQTNFAPEDVTGLMIETYKTQKQISESSFERHLSSLRKFFSFLLNEKHATRSPFEHAVETAEDIIAKDPWRFRNFKNYLYLQKAAHLTIKNYIIDVRQFLIWAQEVTGVNNAWEKKNKDLLSKITPELIEEYRNRLLTQAIFSPVSINRKLSSLRKYIAWATKEGFIPEMNTDEVIENVSIDNQIDPSFLNTPVHLFEKSLAQEDKQYATFPPLRLAQTITRAAVFSFDKLLVIPIAKLLQIAEVAMWKLKGKQLFINDEKKEKPATALFSNVKKSFYAPFSLATASYPLHKKILYHARYTRPKWYKRYQNTFVIRYFQYATLVLLILSIGIGGYKAFFQSASVDLAAFERQQGSSQILSFKGNLTDKFGNPITTPSTVRFTLYSDRFASGSALLWQEVNNVKPDQSGNFSTLLGTGTHLKKDLFTNPSLYLGITLGVTPELNPRKEIPTGAYASNTDTVGGMLPITQDAAGTKNVILALNSAGDLTIGSGANPTFRATDGTFTLLGNSVILGTNTGSSGDVLLQPDGFGQIDLQKPLHNSSNNNNISTAVGAVEIDDMLAILATSSGQSAFVINQNGLGPIISASASGIARFTLDGNGNGYFSGNLGIGIPSPTQSLDLLGNIQLQNLGRTMFSYLPSTLQIGGGRTASESGNIVFGNGQGWKFFIGRASDNAATKFVTFQDNGFVGIGTITPQSFLHTEGISANGGTLAIFNQLNGNANILSASAAGLTKFVIASSGNIGIGTVKPLARLHISDSQNATASAIIENKIALNSNDPTGILIKLGTDGTNPDANDRFITFVKGDNSVVGKISGNSTGGISYSTTGSDFAEYYKKADPHENMNAGDIVCLAANLGVTKCNSGNQNLLGVVSDKAGFVGGSNHQGDNSYVLVGLVGQLPVTVADNAQKINISDPITVDQISGRATKATSYTITIGRALESWDPKTGSTKVLVSLSPGVYDPSISINESGDVSGYSIIANQSQSGSYNLQDANNQTINRIALFSKGIIANLQTGIVTAETATVKTITAVNGQIDNLQTTSIISPIARIDRLATGFISPIGRDASIGVQINKDNVTIINTKNAGQTVATIDSQGNASFSGTLQSQSLQTQDATISGTLHAGHILASQIDGLPQQQVTNVTNVYATPAAQQTVQTPFATGSGRILAIDSIKPLIDSYLHIASFSSDLAAIDTLRSKTMQVDNGFMSFGPTSLADTSITGTLTIGSQLILSDTSINVMGSDLQLQPLRQGGVAIAGGNVYIDTDGNIAITGNATIKGTLTANIISPLAQQDLTIKLGDTQNAQSSLVVKNASNAAVLSVSSVGDLVASGAATIAKLNFNPVGKAFAISDTEIVASGSAGIATISARQSEITIDNNLVTDKSLIYITQTADSSNVVLYVSRQIPNQSFTVGTSQRIAKPLPFNWLIIN